MRLRDRAELARVMKVQGLSVRQLAEGICSHSMIQQLKTGHRTSCSPALAVAIAGRLDVGVDYLFAAQGSSPAGLSAQRGRVSA